MTNHPIRISFLVAASAFGLAANAHAQQAPTTAASANAPIAEVVVTAEKRSTNVQTTPSPITALSGDALQAKSITNLESLMTSSPSLSFANQGPTSAINIRGIGLGTSSPLVASGVPIYRDGIQAPTLLSNEPFVDVADVEVLRGPQGTLVGSNSTGGAVFINTKNPVIGSHDGYAQIEGGSYSRVGAQGAVNVPINDTLAVRFAGSYLQHDSYWTDTLPTAGVKPGALNQWVGRVSVLYKPVDNFTALLKVNLQDDHDGGFATKPYAGTPPSFGQPTGNYQLAYPDPNTQESDAQIRTSLELNYKLPNGINLRSISGMFYTHEYYDEEAYANTSTTTAKSTPSQNTIDDRVWSQEFNIVSPGSDQFHWVLGAYGQFWPAHISLVPNTLASTRVDEGTIKNAYALFGEGGYDLTSKLEIHAGLRETFDHTFGTGGVYAVTPTSSTQLAPNNDAQTDQTTTGRIGLNYKATADQFFYAFAAKGAKTGGVNGVGLPNFAPESVWDYEGGVKSYWFDHHLHTQLGVFYMDYQNLQLTAASPRIGATPGNSILNAGASTIKGVEFSSQGRFGAWQIDGNLAYTASSVSAGKLLNTYLYSIQGLTLTGLQCAAGQTTGCSNFTPYYQSASGVDDPFAPRWTANIGVAYAFDLGGDAVLTPRADFAYTSSQWTTVFENPVDKLQERKLLNLSLTWNKADWTVTAFGTNVTNSYFATGQTTNADFYNAPAEYGVRLAKRF